MTSVIHDSCTSTRRSRISSLSTWWTEPDARAAKRSRSSTFIAEAVSQEAFGVESYDIGDYDIGACPSLGQALDATVAAGGNMYWTPMLSESDPGTDSESEDNDYFALTMPHIILTPPLHGHASDSDSDDDNDYFALTIPQIILTPPLRAHASQGGALAEVATCEPSAQDLVALAKSAATCEVAPEFAALAEVAAWEPSARDLVLKLSFWDRFWQHISEMVCAS